MFVRISRENKEDIVRLLQEHFYQERAEDLGDLAAENLLDFFTKEMGPYFYNQGVNDARKMVDQKMIGLEEDIRSLERPIRRR